MTNYSWPVNARSVVFVSVNFDAESFDLKETSPERLYGRFSYGRYGTRAGLPRLTALLQKHDIPATFFVPAADAKRHPNEIHALIKDGYEIAARGIDMEDFATLGDKEFQILKDKCKILMLDDINVDKCKLIVKEIESDPSWKIIKKENTRNGFLIAEKI